MPGNGGIIACDGRKIPIPRPCPFSRRRKNELFSILHNTSELLKRGEFGEPSAYEVGNVPG